MGVKLEWYRVEDAVPAKGERVLVASGENWTPGRLTNYGWRDDQSKPIHFVTRWSYVTVAADETA